MGAKQEREYRNAETKMRAATSSECYIDRNYDLNKVCAKIP
jgi:hypothetical protein